MDFTNLKLGQVNSPIFIGDSNQAKKVLKSDTANTVNFNAEGYQPNTDIEGLDSELASLIDELGLNEINSEEGVVSTEALSASDTISLEDVMNADPLTEAEKAEAQKKLKELQTKYDKNVKIMEQIQKDVENLVVEVEKSIDKVLDAKELAEKENERIYQAVVDEQLKAYIKANQEGGEGMTREQLQENIKKSLPGSPNIGNAIAASLEANEQMDQIDSLLCCLNTIIAKTRPLENQIQLYNILLNKSEDVPSAPASSCPSEGSSCSGNGDGKCDPIGFISEDVEYNFFRDKDGDRDLSTTSEFLGFNNYW